MKPAPFEQFIKSLLDQTAISDALRDLSSRNLPIQGSSLLSAVDAILLEESIAAQFDPDGYDSPIDKERVLSKLFKVRDVLNSNIVMPGDPDFIAVELCIQHVTKGFALTKNSLIYLNDIYKKYA